MASHDPFPIATARSFAAGASVALSEADAFWTHDEPRTDLCLTEALAALEAARSAVLETIAQRTPQRARRAGGEVVGMVMAASVSAAFVALPTLALVLGRF
jgi:hypothetical protein